MTKTELPPIVVSWEILTLRERLAEAQNDNALLLGFECDYTVSAFDFDEMVKCLKAIL